MFTKDLISIIIPVYNVEKYINECLDSILSQSYGNYEVILVDDGSSDSSPDICRQYCDKDRRFIYLRKENGGASSARNYGLRIAKGEYIYFVDSDDRLCDDCLKKLTDNIGENDFIYFGGYTVDEDTGNIANKNYSYKKEYKQGNGQDVAWELFQNKDFHYVVWLMFFRHDFLEENKIDFVEGIMYEDMIFVYESFVKANRVSHLCENLYYRRFREGSVMMSAKKAKNFVSANRVYYEILCLDVQIDNKEMENFYRAKCAYNAINIYSQLSSKEKSDLKGDYKNLIADVRKNNGFGDKSLVARCNSKLCWYFSKAFAKLFKRKK